MNKLKSLAACAIVATLAACETPPEPASRELTLETTAVVEAINMETRHILLKTEDGRRLTIVAGPEVRNLDQVEPGDRIKASYYESVAVQMATHIPQPTQASSTISGRSPSQRRAVSPSGHSFKQ